jgi:hypothetical protein
MGGNGSVQIDFVPTTEGELYSYGAYAAGTLTMLVNRNHPTIEWLRSTLYVSEQNASVADLWKRLDHLAKWQALSYMALHRYENKSFDTLKEKFQDCEFSRIFANPLILGRNLRDKCGKAKAMAVAVDDQQ